MRVTASVGSRAIVFDADDTLWATQELYDDAKARFFSLLAALGHDPSTVAGRFAEIDVRNVSGFGFARARFPTSMRETYEFFCAAAGQPARDDLRAQVTSIGESVFDAKPVVRADAAEVLSLLQPMYRLVLFTAGDTDVQWSRVHHSGLESYFERIRVVTEKTTQTWGDLLRDERLRPSGTWSVGNSVRSDINPAVHLGLRAVLVSAGMWEYERAEVRDGAVWRVDTLRDGAAIVLREDGALADAERRPATSRGA